MSLHRLVAAVPATLLLVAPVEAADLPVAVEPIDYVRICDAFGSGFFFIPGTNTCLRVRGRVRTDYNVFYDLDDDDFEIESGRGFDSDEDIYRFRARGYVYLDARTPTEFGLLRTFSEFEFTQDNAEDLDIDLEQAFIQLGGLRLGRTTSFYDYGDAEFTPTQFFDAQISDGNEQNVIAYQFDFNETFSGTLSIEDNTGRREGLTDFFNPVVGNTAFATDSRYGGAQIPDVIGVLRAEGGFGSAQLMGATHYVNAITDGVGVTPAGTTLTFRETDEELGFAVGGGVALNVPFGNGTVVGVTSTYSEGAINFASTDISAPFGLATDGIVTAGGDLRLTEYISVSGGGETEIAPNIEAALQAGFGYADVADAGTDLNGDGRVDDLDFFNLDLQGFIGWTPVSGFIIGAGAEYRLVDTEDFGDSSFLTTYLRVQRSY